MGHILGHEAHVSIATLGMEIWDREYGPLGTRFTVSAILGQVGNTISPWGKGPSQKIGGILVAYFQGSIDIGFRICSSGLAGNVQPRVRATLPNFQFLAVFCPVV